MTDETNNSTPETPSVPTAASIDFFSSAGDGVPQQANADNFGKAAPWETSLSKKADFDGETVRHEVFLTGEGEEVNPYDSRYEILAKASTQALEDTWNYGGLSSVDEVVEPLYNMEQLTVLNDINVTRAKCIEAIAEYTCGLGFRIKKLDPHAETVDSDKVSELVRKQLEKWASRDEKTFTELMVAVKTDEETTGNGFIEVSRNRKGEIDGLYHCPAHTMRVRRDRSGYIQQRGTNKVPFYRFGDKVQLYDDNTIALTENRDQNINEIIHFKRANPRSTYYGVPRDVAAIVTIAGDEMARNHNIKFFTNSATPEICLVFETPVEVLSGMAGDQPVKPVISEQTKRQIIEHFRRNLAAKTFEPGLFFLPSGVKLTIEKVSQGQKDSGWTKYRQANRDEIRMAFRTPPVIIGDSGSSGGYATAAIEKAVYQEGVIDPEQTRYEQRLMGLLWPEMVMITQNKLAPKIEEDGSPAAPVVIKPEDGSGVNPDIWILEFRSMDVADKAVQAANHQIYGTLQAITKNEIRADIGKRPMEGGDEPPKPPESGDSGGSRVPDPNDLRNLAGRAGGGRGPNGTVTPGLPRRPFEQNPQTPANITTVGTPMAKRAEDEFREAVDNVLGQEEPDTESLEELQEQIEANPELLEKLAEDYVDAVEEAFAKFVAPPDENSSEKSDQSE